MSQPTRSLSNAELGRRIGLSPSGASYLRNGQRMPGEEVLRAIVSEFDASYDVLINAIIEARQGNADRWVVLLNELTQVPVEDAAAQSA
jgi:transcriptional regulator with XRE-family HTH domain